MGQRSGETQYKVSLVSSVESHRTHLILPAVMCEHTFQVLPTREVDMYLGFLGFSWGHSHKHAVPA